MITDQGIEFSYKKDYVKILFTMGCYYYCFFIFQDTPVHIMVYITTNGQLCSCRTKSELNLNIVISGLTQMIIGSDLNV